MCMNKIDPIKILNFSIKQRGKTWIYVIIVIHTRGVSSPLSSLSSVRKVYTCFQIQDPYFSCLQPSKPDASQEENSLRLEPLFSPFSRPCYLEECLPRQFPPLLDATSYSLPISTEINDPISPLFTLLF